MTNIDRAAEIISLATRGAHTTDGHPMKMSDHTAQIIAEALADAGLLAPEPQIIRTREELAALDPDTLLIDADDPWYDVRLCAHEWMEDYTIETEGFFPLAVIATGDTVRAAQQALDSAE